MDTLRRKGKQKRNSSLGVQGTNEPAEQKTVNPLMAQLGSKNGAKPPTSTSLPSLDMKSMSLRGPPPSGVPPAMGSRSPRGGPLSPRAKVKETVRSNPIFQYYTELINTSHKAKKVWDEEHKEEEKEKEKEQSLTKVELRHKSKLGSVSSKSDPHLSPPEDGTHPEDHEVSPRGPHTLRARSAIDVGTEEPDSPPKKGKKKKKKKKVGRNKDQQRLSVFVDDPQEQPYPLRRVVSDGDLCEMLLDPKFTLRMRRTFPRRKRQSGSADTTSDDEDDSHDISESSSPAPSLASSSSSNPTEPPAASAHGAADSPNNNNNNNNNISNTSDESANETDPLASGRVLRRVLSDDSLRKEFSLGTTRGGNNTPASMPTGRTRRTLTNLPGRASVIYESQPTRARSASVSVGNGPPPFTLPSPASSPTIEQRVERRVKASEGSPTIAISSDPSHTPVGTISEEDQLQWTEKEGRKVVTCGTLDKLVQCLAGGQPDPDYIYSFLLSHTYFTDSVTLLSKLKDRFFNVDIEPNETDETAIKARKMITQLRVVNVLKKWIENHYYFFERDEKLREFFFEFLTEMSSESTQQKEWAALLRKSLEEKPKEESPTVVINSKDEKLRPYLPKNVQSSQLTFIDMHPLEVARQMTLIDHSIFSLIEPGELYKTAWAKGDKTKAPNVIELTERFNKICFWVATEIISTKNPKMRVEVLSRFIQLAMYLRSMNNFHGVMEIYAALNMGCVQRLKGTWKEVDKKEIGRLKEIEAMFDPTSNYKNYRERLEAVSPPIIPFQAVYLADLTFIEEIPSFMENGLVNFEKMRLLGKVISEIERYQKCPYSFFLVPPIEDFFKNSLTCLSEKELYDLAKQHELEMKEDKGGTLRKGDPITMGTLKFDKQRKKQIKELEKQERKLMRSISFRSQNKGARVRSSTFT